MNETSRASLVGITPGLANTFNRAPLIARRCKKCKMNIPRYPGRYPSACPRCEGALETVESVETA